MRILLFVSVLALLCCLGVLVAVIVNSNRKSDSRKADDADAARGRGKTRPNP